MTNECWMQVVALGLFLSCTMATQDNEYYQYWHPAHGQQLIQEATGYRRQSASPRQALAALGALASSPVANLAVAAAGTVGSVAFTATQASALSSRADDLAKRMDTSDSTVSGLSTSASTQGARISSLETTTTSLSSTSSTSSTSIINVCTVLTNLLKLTDPVTTTGSDGAESAPTPTAVSAKIQPSGNTYSVASVGTSGGSAIAAADGLAAHTATTMGNDMNTNTALSVSSFNTFRKQVADAINILDKKIREILDSDITGGDNTGATVALASCPTSK